MPVNNILFIFDVVTVEGEPYTVAGFKESYPGANVGIDGVSNDNSDGDKESVRNLTA